MGETLANCTAVLHYLLVFSDACRYAHRANGPRSGIFEGKVSASSFEVAQKGENRKLRESSPPGGGSGVFDVCFLIFVFSGMMGENRICFFGVWIGEGGGRNASGKSKCKEQN